MAEKINTPFKDAVTPKSTFTVKPTLGNDPSGTASDSGVSGKVTPKPLPSTKEDFKNFG